MRRTDREIRDINEIIQVMEQCDVCRLALNDEEGYPYILPLNFGMRVEDGQITLYFHGADTGRKYELLAKDDRVSFEMDRGHNLVLDEAQGNCTMEYESVIGRGRVDIVPEEEKLDALMVLMAHYRSEDFPFNHAAVPHTTVMRLTVEQLTGKRRAKAHPAMGRNAE
ncbi:MAG: pyridoxamine 5'-phosphate oxidase family protein [Oscillospiraceae bacterium]|nr:pyridoxamine 5'-phosphate oxidase family protein [Oscillospiraceae bacterium]